jgi:hypothetical protein
VALVVRHAGKLAAEIPPSVRPPTAAWRAGEVRKELDRLDRGTVREHRDKRT